jgi:RAD51-like protein 2
MQLCVNVQIPIKYGGCEGEAILIDSEGSFSAVRCASIAEGLVEHLQRVQGNKSNPQALTLSVESILRRIHVFRVFDSTEQLALFASIPSFLASHPNVRLIVVDSIAFHFRRGFGNDFSVRSRILLNMASSLAAIACQYKLAVVLSNHVTTKFDRKIIPKTNHQENDSFSIQESSHLSPALGESWAHTCATRVLLYWNSRIRAAKLLKSSSKRTASCSYSVTEKGVRDVTASSSSSSLHSSSSVPGGSPIVDNNTKRPRDATNSSPTQQFHPSDRSPKRFQSPNQQIPTHPPQSQFYTNPSTNPPRYL